MQHAELLLESNSGYMHAELQNSFPNYSLISINNLASLLQETGELEGASALDREAEEGAARVKMLTRNHRASVRPSCSIARMPSCVNSCALLMCAGAA